MSDLMLRPRSATELVDAAFQVYRQAPVQFMAAVAVVYVPWLVVQLAFDVTITPTKLPGGGEIAWLVVVGILIFSIVGGATALVARDVYLGQTLDLARDFRALVPQVPRLVAVSVVVVLIVAVGTVIAVVPVSVLIALMGGQVAAVVLGAVFFFASAAYLFARFYAVRQTVVLEDAGVALAIRRASRLSRGLKLHIISALVLVGIVTFAVDIGGNLLFGLTQSRVLVQLGSTVVAVIVGPLFGITETVLYYDLRIRNEGFDVEYLAGLAAPVSSQPSDATA